MSHRPGAFTCPNCGHSVAPPPPELLRLGRVTVNTGTYEVFVDGEPRHLPPIPTAILIALMRRPGCILSKDTLMDMNDLWEVFPKTMDVHIWRLRQKVGDALDIRTVWGKGWFVPDPALA